MQQASGIMRVFRELLASDHNGYWRATAFVERSIVDILGRRSKYEPSRAAARALGEPHSEEALLASGTAATASTPSVFASYSHEDAEIVSPIVQLARIPGTIVFLDRDSIRPGDDWADRIANAVSASDVMMVFWSRHSAVSRAVQQEYEQALALAKRIVPVLLDSTPLERRLKRYQWVDLRREVSSVVLTTDEDDRRSGPLELRRHLLDAITIGVAASLLLRHVSQLEETGMGGERD